MLTGHSNSDSRRLKIIFLYINSKRYSNYFFKYLMYETLIHYRTIFSADCYKFTPMTAKKNILIAGGSGFIGQYLSGHFSDNGYPVSLLGRKINKKTGHASYFWDPAKGIIDPEALYKKDVIINLSGAGIADRIWTKKRKDIIYRSRIESTSLLANTIIENKFLPSLFINASAIGYYGNRPGELLSETSSPGKGFVSELCIDWEKETQMLKGAGIPVAVLRIGIVLGTGGGSLAKMKLPIQFGLNILFGKGSHFISWIHIHDLTRIIEELISGNLSPKIYNVVSPHPSTQREFNSEISNILGKKTMNITIPKALLQFIVGDLSTVLLADQKIQPHNLMDKNYHFSFPDLETALSQLLHK